MKYALLIYDVAEAWQDLSETERVAISREYVAISELPGVYGGAQLQPAASATTVQTKDNETRLTDGPFVTAKEFLGGYYLFATENVDAALELAARIPAARLGGAIEVRPIAER